MKLQVVVNRGDDKIVYEASPRLPIALSVMCSAIELGFALLGASFSRTKHRVKFKRPKSGLLGAKSALTVVDEVEDE